MVKILFDKFAFQYLFVKLSVFDGDPRLVRDSHQDFKILLLEAGTA